MLAGSVVSGSALARVEPDKEACGLEDAPQFGKTNDEDEPPVLTRAAVPRYVAAQARIDAALRTSGDPLDRAVADLLNVGDMRSESGAGEAVVQQAAMTTDPRLYALGYGLCQSPRTQAPSCRTVTLQRWMEVDPDNGIPWLYQLGQAQARGDAAGVRAAMAHLAAASRFDIDLGAVPGAVAARMPDDPLDLAAVGDLATRAMGIAASLPLPTFQPLIQVCRDHAGGDEGLAQSCRAISDTMFEHTDNLITHSISGALLLQTTGDGSRREAVRAEHALLFAHLPAPASAPECRAIREGMRKMLRMGQVGELEAMRERARQSAAP